MATMKLVKLSEKIWELFKVRGKMGDSMNDVAERLLAKELKKLEKEKESK